MCTFGKKYFGLILKKQVVFFSGTLLERTLNSVQATLFTGFLKSFEKKIEIGSQHVKKRNTVLLKKKIYIYFFLQQNSISLFHMLRPYFNFFFK